MGQSGTEEPVHRGGRHLSRTQRVPRPRAEVFEFFANPANLERITPPFLRFRIVTPQPITMGVGTLIDYRLRLYGLPVRWRTVIEAYDPPFGFTDVQLRGPYRRWVHRHEFVEVAEGTEVRDRVDYELPFPVCDGLTDRLLVRPSLERIFEHRRAVIAEFFAGA